jgi:hypothetical protein
MKKNYKSLKKYVFILAVSILLLGTQACNLGTQGFEESPPGDFLIEFNADRTQLAPGECTMLFWHTEGGFDVTFNGEPVGPAGEREECLNDTRTFVLEVDTGEGRQKREVEVTVGGQPGSGPQPQPQPQNPPSNQCQSNFETDIAVTDIYTDNLPHGQVHIRITNHGPCTLQNVKDDIYCFLDKTDQKTNQVSYDSVTVSVVYNISLGGQETYPTGINLDTNTYDYKVTCNLQPGNFNELDSSNNSFEEKFP